MKTVSRLTRSILVAPDKFKGSLSSDEAAEVIGLAIHARYPEAEVILLPMADGGEGSLDLILRSLEGQRLSAAVSDPLGRKIQAEYGYFPHRRTLFIEMAKASGLSLLKTEERNPLFTSTRGTGDIMVEGLQRDPARILFGLGGSSTNDGGTGMATALGYRFLDRNGKILHPTGENLRQITRIEIPERELIPSGTKIIAGCDVDSPLYGLNGAAQLFAKQKGAGENDIAILEEGLLRLADVVEKWLGKDLSKVPGAGAAGGLAYGLMAFAGARLQSGFEMLADHAGFREKLKNCQLVITGEGKLDEQTLQGKTVAGICRMANQEGIPVIAVTGWCPHPEEIQKALNLKQIISLAKNPDEIGFTMQHAKEVLHRTIREALQI